MISGRSAEFPAGDSANPDVKAANATVLATLIGLIVAYLRGARWIIEAPDVSHMADLPLFTDWVSFSKAQAVRMCMSNFDGDACPIKMWSDLAWIQQSSFAPPSLQLDNPFVQHTEVFAKFFVDNLKVTISQTRQPRSSWDRVYEFV